MGTWKYNDGWCHVGWMLAAMGSLVAMAVEPGDVMRLTLDSKDSGPRATFDSRGCVTSLEFKRTGGWETVQFRSDEHAGPQWMVEDGDGWHAVPMTASRGAAPTFTGSFGQVAFGLRYELRGTVLAIKATAHNKGTTAFNPVRAGIQLGINTSMEKYPDWNDLYFPTLLRCERTHFWGYLMTPSGRILGIGSPDPVASWHLDYKQLQHRIHTVAVDFLNAPPLPDRHPAGLTGLKPGEKKTWTLCIEDIPSLDKVKAMVGHTIAAPMIDCDRYTVGEGETVAISILSDKPVKMASIATPKGGMVKIAPERAGAGMWSALFTPSAGPGMYVLSVVTSNGMCAEARITMRRPWSWYLLRARSEAVAKPQKASSHTESWYGLFPCFAARRLFPNPSLDRQADSKFKEIWPLMYDMKAMQPTSWHDRIQNHACAAGLMVARYRATGNVRDLEFAASLADFILAKQVADGSYRNNGTHYTSVVYIGKSLMEVMACEKELAANDPAWKKRYDRHAASVRRAMDDLAAHRDNIDTEGERTYEDGMISCSCTQLGLAALLATNAADRAKYLDAALHLRSGHRCVSQMLVPDSRMNGGSLRFWESQYDVLMSPNMLNSPHGWSAWRIYGLWYLYLLCGDPSLLREAMNALGSCVQVVDSGSGELRWAFVPDPYVEAEVFEQFMGSLGKGRCVPRIIGEQYVPMISGWYKAPDNTFVSGYWGGDKDGEGLKPGEAWPVNWGNYHNLPTPWGGDGGCCDNDVHEIFKCLDEVAVTAAYVIEMQDGGIESWNCRVQKSGGTLVVTPDEPCVTRVHLNLRRAHAVSATIADKDVAGMFEGKQWIGPGGVPELLR